MEQLLQIFIWLPILAILIIFFVPPTKEKIISGIAISSVGCSLAAIIIFTLFWLVDSLEILDSKHIVFYKTESFELFIDFYFDRVTLIFSFVGSVIAVLVFIFSRYYMHREAGFKRFFITILLFFTGYNLVIFAGNFETLFIGWEILGISSFLLIAFYRDRYLPVRNSLKVISVFRLSDVCLILAIWMSHHLWHENITFIKLDNPVLIHEHLQQDYGLVIFISLMILIAATAKSAQIPFSSWLPRAMEGPTTSSAIFYGSLSVHLGVFILLRTYPLWENLVLIKVMLILVGFTTGIVATGIARVQSSVKTQIAYSSAAQIGIIFIEVALGFHVIALVHFTGNAFLRTYQMLVSPSVMSYLIHDQFYNFSPRNPNAEYFRFKKLTYSLYILCIKEWNLDFILNRFLWTPFKWVGNKLGFIDSRITQVILFVFYLFGLYCFYFNEKVLWHGALPQLFSFLALMLILKAFSERGDAIKVWALIFSSHFFIAISIALNVHFEFHQILIYLSGGLLSAVVGFVCLHKIKSLDNDISLNKYHGYVYEYPSLALVFLLSCLGLVAFPITPAFIGMDLLISHIQKDQLILIINTSLYFLFIELSVLRLYARIFLGQHKKAYHPIAFRSS